MFASVAAQNYNIKAEYKSTILRDVFSLFSPYKKNIFLKLYFVLILTHWGWINAAFSNWYTNWCMHR